MRLRGRFWVKITIEFIRRISSVALNPINSRWAVEVLGSEITISRLESFLSSNLRHKNDTFISRFRDVPGLRSSLWDSLTDPTVVRDVATTELRLLEGLTKLSGGASPLTVGTIFELDENDNILTQTSTSTNIVHILSREIDTTENFGYRLAAVRNDENLMGAAIELSGTTDWIKIYKAIEHFEDKFGGEKELARVFPDAAASLKRIKRTAQSARHRARAFQAIIRPYKLTDAAKFLEKLFDRIVFPDNLKPKNKEENKFFVRSRPYPPEIPIAEKPTIYLRGEIADVALVGDELEAR